MSDQSTEPVVPDEPEPVVEPEPAVTPAPATAKPAPAPSKRPLEVHLSEKDRKLLEETAAKADAVYSALMVHEQGGDETPVPVDSSIVEPPPPPAPSQQSNQVTEEKKKRRFW